MSEFSGSLLGQCYFHPRHLLFILSGLAVYFKPIENILPQVYQIDNIISIRAHTICALPLFVLEHYFCLPSPAIAGGILMHGSAVHLRGGIGRCLACSLQT